MYIMLGVNEIKELLNIFETVDFSMIYTAIIIVRRKY